MSQRKLDKDSRRGEAGSAPARYVSDWLALVELISGCRSLLRSAVAARAQCASISEPQFALLWTCARHDGVSQSELAEGLDLSAAHVSGMVEQLSVRGLIRGERASRDRRRQIWRLTELGTAVVEQVVGELVPWCHALDSRFDERRRDQLARALEEFLAALGDTSNSAPVLPLDSDVRETRRPPTPSRSGTPRRTTGGAA